MAADNDDHLYETYDPEERAREKQRSRDQDVADLASGAITREQLRAKNSPFAGLKWVMRLDRARSLV